MRVRDLAAFVRFIARKTDSGGFNLPDCCSVQIVDEKTSFRLDCRKSRLQVRPRTDILHLHVGYISLFLHLLFFFQLSLYVAYSVMRRNN